MKTPEEIGRIIGEGLKMSVRKSHPNAYTFVEEARLTGASLSIPTNFVSEGDEKEAKSTFEGIRADLVNEIRSRLIEILDPGTVKFVFENGEQLNEGWDNYDFSLIFQRIARNRLFFLLRFSVMHPKGASMILPVKSAEWK